MAFTRLAKSILRDAEALDAYIQANNLPQPSFDAEGPARTVFSTPEATAAHASLLANTHELHHLAQGPTAIWMGTFNGALGDAMTTAAICHFKIADHVPLNAAASFEDVAMKCGLALRDFKMIVRYAMTNFVFREPRPGFIAHTAASRVLVGNLLLKVLTGMSRWELFPCIPKELEAMEKHPGSEEPTESAWALTYKASNPMFTELEAHYPDRAANFVFAMEALATLFADQVLLDAYDWAKLGPATIVDVGGGKGMLGRALAKYFPTLKFIVQDLEGTAAAGRTSLPADLSDRISFTTHDFFTVQPVHGADVYFFRAIFHNWPDKYCVQILRVLVPALTKGARVVILDPHTPDPLTSLPWQERQARASNLRMKVLFNSHDREAGEWEGLFRSADERFKVHDVRVTAREQGNRAGPSMVTVEAVWED